MNKIAVNGLGRIGRLVLRHFLDHPPGLLEPESPKMTS